MLEYVILHQVNAHVMLADTVLIAQVSNLVEFNCLYLKGYFFTFNEIFQI